MLTKVRAHFEVSLPISKHAVVCIPQQTQDLCVLDEPLVHLKRLVNLIITIITIITTKSD